MATFDPEAIQAALFARLSGIASLGSFKSRRYIDFSQISREQMPALICVSTNGNAGADAGEPASEWSLGALVLVYVKEPDDRTKTAETAAFLAWKQARALLQVQAGEAQPDPGHGTTLGGLVFSCLIRDFQIHQEDGAGVATISFRVEMTAAD